MRPGTCIHFNGILNECCDKGVNFEELAGCQRTAMWARIPCTSQSRNSTITCAKMELPTAEQIAKSEEEDKLHMAKYMKVFAVVGVWRQKEPKGKAEVIVCPECGGNLHLHQARSNGHVHGKCETAGCVSWME